MWFSINTQLILSLINPGTLPFHWTDLSWIFIIIFISIRAINIVIQWTGSLVAFEEAVEDVSWPPLYLPPPPPTNPSTSSIIIHCSQDPTYASTYVFMTHYNHPDCYQPWSSYMAESEENLNVIWSFSKVWTNFILKICCISSERDQANYWCRYETSPLKGTYPIRMEIYGRKRINSQRQVAQFSFLAATF